MLKFTPRDIQNQEFKKVIRGYDPIEVDTFLEIIADEFELLLRQKKELDDKVLKYETELKNFKQVEGTLQETLIEAKRSTAETQESSRREADIKMREAEFSAQQITESARRELRKLQDEIAFLKTQKESFVRRLKEWVSVLELEEDEITELSNMERRRRKGNFSEDFQSGLSERHESENVQETETSEDKSKLNPEPVDQKPVEPVLPPQEERPPVVQMPEKTVEEPMRTAEEPVRQREEPTKPSPDKGSDQGESIDIKSQHEEQDESPPQKFHNGFNLIDKIIDEDDDDSSHHDDTENDNRGASS